MSEFSLPADFDLSDHFDHSTLMRAIGLKPEQALLSEHEDSGRLHTRLRGSSTAIYEQTISFFIDPRTGLHLRGLCTCPMGFNCQHVAAALMAHEAALVRARRLGIQGAGIGGAADVGADMAVRTAPRAGQPAEPLSRSPGSGVPTHNFFDGAGLPPALESWLDGAKQAFVPSHSDDEPVPPELPRVAAGKRLMYVLSSSDSRMTLKLHLGSARRGGEISRHHPHAPSVADILRTRPSYVGVDDEFLLAALLPFTLNRPGAQVSLAGRTAAATLRQLVRAGACWFVDSPDTPPDTPPGAPLTWLDAPLPLRLQWHADEKGQWSTRWEADPTAHGDAADPVPDVPALNVVSLVLLPQPHVVISDAAGQMSVRPADVSGSGLSGSTIHWLAGMPPVPNTALPALVGRLRDDRPALPSGVRVAQEALDRPPVVGEDRIAAGASDVEQLQRGQAPGAGRGRQGARLTGQRTGADLPRGRLILRGGCGGRCSPGSRRGGHGERAGGHHACGAARFDRGHRPFGGAQVGGQRAAEPEGAAAGCGHRSGPGTDAQ